MVKKVKLPLTDEAIKDLHAGDNVCSNWRDLCSPGCGS